MKQQNSDVREMGKWRVCGTMWGRPLMAGSLALVLPLLPIAFSLIRSEWSHTEENLSVGWKGRGCILLAENAKRRPRLISYTIVKMMERWVRGAVVETGSNDRWFSSAARSFKASKQERKHLDLVVSFIWSTYVTPLKHMPFSRTLLRECFFLF